MRCWTWPALASPGPSHRQRSCPLVRRVLRRVTPTANSCIQTDPVDFWDENEEADQGPAPEPELEASTPSELAGHGSCPATHKDASACIAPSLTTRKCALVLCVAALQRDPRGARKKKRPNRVLGGFEGLISSDRQGRIRGLQWTQAAICNMYADKIVQVGTGGRGVPRWQEFPGCCAQGHMHDGAPPDHLLLWMPAQDAVADRDTRPRARICEFALEWHLNKCADIPGALHTGSVGGSVVAEPSTAARCSRSGACMVLACRYGLRNLAELNVIDLIASARHHAKSVPRIKWFAQFIGAELPLWGF